MSGAWAEGNVTPGRRIQRLERPRGAGDPAGLRPSRGLRHPGTDRAGADDAGPDRRMAASRQRTVPAGGVRHPGNRAALVPASVGSATPLHDPCAVAWLIRPDLFTARACSVRMDLGPGPCRGRTVIDRWGRTGDPLNATVLETVDADGFFASAGPEARAFALIVAPSREPSGDLLNGPERAALRPRRHARRACGSGSNAKARPSTPPRSTA